MTDTKTSADYGDIQCPYCGYRRINDDGPGDLVTYWGGEEGPVEVACSGCDNSYWVKELVLRSFTVAKDREAAND